MSLDPAEVPYAAEVLTLFYMIPGFNPKNGLVNQVASPLSALEQDVQGMFDSFFGDSPLAQQMNAPQWGLDIEERQNETLVRAELPGFEVSDLDVQVHEDMLTIVAKHSEEAKPAGSNEQQGETLRIRRVRNVRRSVRLPKGHDTENIDANYRNGVLELRIPRRADAVGRKVEIRG